MINITEEQWTVLREALEKWGELSQRGMAIEEYAEAIVALRKLDRVGGREISDGAKSNAIDEIADVFVMSYQMAEMLGIDAVKDRIEFKIERLRNRLQYTDANPSPQDALEQLRRENDELKSKLANLAADGDL